MKSVIEQPEAEALIQGYVEGSLTESESTRLHALLEQDPSVVQALLDGLREESLLRIVLAELPVTRPVRTQTDRLRFLRLFINWGLRARFASAGCAIALLAAAIWWLCPTIGEPVLAEVNGTGIILERAARLLPAEVGTQLRPLDLLRTGGVTATIGFGREDTRIVIRPGTELQFASTSGAKRFNLHIGKLEAVVARQPPFRPMVVATPQAEARVLGTRFTLTVTSNATRLEVAQGRVRLTRTGDYQSVRVPAGHYAVAAGVYELAALPSTGNVLREFWTGVSAKNMQELEQDLRRPDRADLVDRFELAPFRTNHLAVRFRGYLHPPTSGDYEFWLAGATEATLFMSPDQRPEGKAVIAYALDAGTTNTWDTPRFRGPSPWSSAIPLVAGRCYYIEAILLVRDGTGQLSVAWKGPGRQRELLTGKFMSPFEPKK